MTEKLDIGFIHTPKFNDFYEPLGEMTFINIIPSGVFALADLLDSRGFKCAIFHMGLEFFLKKRFDPCDFIKIYDPDVIAFSLHWHHQAYDVLEAARMARNWFPDKIIILGGLTASCFATEILEQFNFIDGVFAGDSEKPLLDFMELVKKFKEAEESERNDDCPVPVRSLFSHSGFRFPLMDIPNFKFLGEGRIHESEKRYCISPEEFARLKYYRTELLIDSRFYIDYVGIPSMMIKKRTLAQQDNLVEKFKQVYFPMAGRGCPFSCPWCGREERKTLLRPAEAVAEGILQARNRGLVNLYFTFSPTEESYDYYRKLFKLIKPDDFEPLVYFECWDLPGEDFMDLFAETFENGIIALSPGSGDEELRMSSGGSFYTNEKFYETLEYLQKIDVAADLFFSMGVPGENEERFQKTSAMIQRINSRFKNVEEICLSCLEMEPGSPWYKDPDRYGIVSFRKTLMDFYEAHGPWGRGSFTSTGYVIPGYFRDLRKSDRLEDFEDNILELRCKTWCFLPTLVKTFKRELFNPSFYPSCKETRHSRRKK